MYAIVISMLRSILTNRYINSKLNKFQFTLIKNFHPHLKAFSNSTAFYFKNNLKI